MAAHGGCAAVARRLGFVPLNKMVHSSYVHSRRTPEAVVEASEMSTSRRQPQIASDRVQPARAVLLGLFYCGVGLLAVLLLLPRWPAPHTHVHNSTAWLTSYIPSEVQALSKLGKPSAGNSSLEGVRAAEDTLRGGGGDGGGGGSSSGSGRSKRPRRPAPAVKFDAISSESMGVRTYALHGVLRNKTFAENVTLHVFLKAVQERRGVVAVRGVGFFESQDHIWAHFVEPHLLKLFPSGVQLEASPLWLNAKINIYLQGGSNNTKHKFKLVKDACWGRPERPFHIETKFKLSGPSYRLGVDGWDGAPAEVNMTWHLDSESRSFLTGTQRKRGPRFAMVLPPFYRMQADVVARLLTHHVAYHRAMGFDNEVLYTRPDSMLNKVVAAPEIQALLGAGHLALLRWTNPLTNIEGVGYPDQSLVENHAILSFWREDTYVALADADEYLVSFTRNTLIADIMLGCMANMQIVAFPRINIASSTLNVRQEAGDLKAELALWTETAAPVFGDPAPAEQGHEYEHPLAQYDSLNLQSARSASGDAEGTGASKYVNPKVIVWPEYAYAHFVHYGFALPGGNASEALLEQAAVNGTAGLCGAFLHLPNLLSYRYNMSGFEEDTSWKWILRRLQQPQQRKRLRLRRSLLAESSETQ